MSGSAPSIGQILVFMIILMIGFTWAFPLLAYFINVIYYGLLSAAGIISSGQTIMPTFTSLISAYVAWAHNILVDSFTFAAFILIAIVYEYVTK